MTDSQQRICPVCGTLTTEPFCPKEGASTVVARSFSKHPRNYEVGDLVGERYRITGALGSGGYAAVYSAEHTGTGQQVAVKLMAFDPTADGGEVAVRRFFREARITAGLTHPHTVRVFDVGQDDGGALYIAMELLRGESLEDLLKRVLTAGEVLSESDALDIMIPVLESLAEAHDRQLVHRDLKPANIFIVKDADGEQVVKVLDFGIARTADSSLTVGGTIPGTPPFMSPEQCRGEQLDGRSDIYSLAVLLFLCVVGRLPFHDTNVLRLMRMHAFEPPPDPRTMTSRPLSDGIVHVLMRSLAKQPGERPSSAAELADELRAIREGRWQPMGLDPDTVADAFQVDDDMPTLATQLPQATTEVEPAPALRPPSQSTAAAPAAELPEEPAEPPAPAPDPAAPAAQPSAPKRDRTLIIVALVVLVIGGVALGVALGKRGSGGSQADVQAGVVFRMAQQASDPARKLDYAREAVKLAPDNATYKAFLDQLAAPAKPGPAAQPTTQDAAPGDPAKQDAAPAPTAAAKAPAVGAGQDAGSPPADTGDLAPAPAVVPPPPQRPTPTARPGAKPTTRPGSKPTVKPTTKPGAKPRPSTKPTRPGAAKDDGALKPQLMD